MLVNPDQISQPARFPETADIETSSDDYASRFSGTTGKWMLRVQEGITLDKLWSRGASTILDVGGGHGQLAVPLCREGFDVTVLGSDESCRKRIEEPVRSGRCRFVVGNVIALPFEDESFDAVISFRLLTHCSRWPELVKELCRVARKSVVVDYPTSQSINMIAPALFRAKKRIEGNTRTWRLFRNAEVRDEFARHGFEVVTRTGQFFLPMVLHRALKCASLSSALEGICRGTGLSGLWGSPVIVELARRD